MGDEFITKQIKAVREILQPFTLFLQSNLKGGKDVDKFAQMVDKLPDEGTLSTGIGAWKAQCRALIDEHRQQRAEAFAEAFAAFVRIEQEKGTQVRELGNSWRIGPLEVEIHRPTARARIRYNHETLLDWGCYLEVAPLQDAYAKALRDLESFNLDSATVKDVLESSAQWALWDQKRKSSTLPLPVQGRAAIPIKDLRPWMKGYLAAKGLPPRTRERADLPMWAFLYQLDAYRAYMASYPDDERILFDAGSQRETRALGVTLNGRKTLEDYKVFCRVVIPSKVASNAP